jgi:hypothetical protein
MRAIAYSALACLAPLLIAPLLFAFILALACGAP